MIKQYFIDNCISIRQWAKKHSLNERIAYMVINGEIAGKYNTSKGNAKRVFEALLSEGIIKRMPENLENKAS
jgi:hypothetical protein